ncbi:MAG: hypothetical protein JEZ11_20720 [Desulfobacterales bacterium]|nr:hypothetical protein [Desulfobacterales bacterium]
MKAIISTTINTQENRMWDELQKISSLMHVASPLLEFKPLSGSRFPKLWHVGEEYQLKLFFLGIVPLGRHSIKLVEIDPEKKEIISNENGLFTKTWNHRIKIETIDSHRITYTDEIEIKAGVLTVSIWLFAHLFYRHRQRKWKQLISR